MVNFNFYFELAALCLLVEVLSIYFNQHFIINKAHYAFLWLWFFSFVIPFANIESVVGINTHNEARYFWATLIYYEAQQLMAYMFMMYSLAPLWRKESLTILKAAGYTIPLLLGTAIIVTNKWTQWIYYCDIETGAYNNGPYAFLVFVTAYTYFGYSIYYVSTRRDVYNEHARHAIYNCIVIIAVFTYLNFRHPLILTRGFAVSLVILQLVIVTMNSHARQDKRTGILNREAFFDWVTSLVYNEIEFDAVLVKAADYEVVVSTYGIEPTLKLRDAILEDAKDMIPKNRGYKLSEDLLCIIFENQNEDDRRKTEQELNNLFIKKRTIDGLDMSFSHLIVTLEYPKRFKTIDELRSLVVYFEKMRRMRYGIMSVEELTIRDLKQEKEVENIIVQALAEGKFEMYYQPIINMQTNRFTTSEALIRMKSDADNYVGPDVFIPIAEKTGLIIQIGDFVVESVFRFISNSNLDELGIDYIELNLSTIQCLQRDFVQKIDLLTSKYNINPSKVCFEITETASNCSPEIFLENLSYLHSKGFKLAIDDFGTGYGNLRRLISMEFDIVKFDKDTTQKIYSDDKVRPLFDRMVKLIHATECKVVAEGVETAEQRDFLRKIGMDYIQGYFYSKPVPEDEYLMFVKEKNVN